MTTTILLAISSLAFSILVLPESTSALALIPILILLFAIIMIEEKRNRISKHLISRPLLTLLTLAVDSVLAFRLYKQFFTSSGEINDIILSSLLKVTGKSQVLAIVLVLALLAIPYICLALHWTASMITDEICKEERRETKLTIGQLLVIFAIAFVTITIFSKSSPLYPLNDWVDANIFLTVGKSMLHGKVLYRDIYEQKGPLLFFLFMLPALISETSFIGLYFIEIFCCFAFLLYSYKIMLLLTRHMPLLFLPVYSFAIYCTASFSHGGSVEELCLPMLAVSLYILTKAVLLKNNRLTVLEAFTNGIFIGCIFWIKYTMLGFYVGYALFVLFSYLWKHEYTDLLKIIGAVLGGIAVVSIPVFAYFIFNHAIPDLVEAYFYNNIFLYSAKSAGLVKNVINGITKAISRNMIVMGIIGIGFFSLLINQRKLAMAVIACFGFSMLFIVTRHLYLYYPFILCAFAPFGFSAVCQITGKKLDLERFGDIRCKLPVAAVVVVLCFVLFLRSSNRYLFLADKESMPQYIFRDIISEDNDQSLFCYGALDLGLFTTTGTVPDTKYFCKFNVDLPEMYSEQQRYIDEAVVNYVVTMDTELSSDNYELSKTVDYYFEGRNRICNLYRRVDR